ncbi:MAG: HNH endonuclease [Ignavibacteriaceae bacterium]|nr:HNH endonuclease [Ignavibacteriaceae bacterium]
MEYITSRGFELPTDQTEMENFDWFNMWSNRNFPYYELLVGDTLYWFDTTAQKLVWKTEVVKVDRFPYSDKQQIFDRYPNSLGLKYYDSRPDSGYFVGYKVKVLEKLDIEKPNGFRFPQLGWLRVDNEIATTWFNRQPTEDTNTLDDNVSDDNKNITELLADLNEKMKNVSPERVEKLVSATIRKDTKIINALKKATDFKCQFPNCGQRITKKNGGFYIEVAHIKPVSQNGQSILGNLIVLCPNHHKEFDFGDLKIDEQTNSKLAGQLNGNKFEIELTYHD